MTRRISATGSYNWELQLGATTHTPRESRLPLRPVASATRIAATPLWLVVLLARRILMRRIAGTWLPTAARPVLRSRRGVPGCRRRAVRIVPAIRTVSIGIAAVRAIVGLTAIRPRGIPARVGVSFE